MKALTRIVSATLLFSLVCLALLLCFGYRTAVSDSITSDTIKPDPSIVLLEPTPTPVPKTVMIFCSRQPTMMTGDPVRLTSKLTGFDGLSVSYQWQCDKGGGFEDVAGATGDSYTFPATSETLGWSWRLVVTYNTD